MFKKILVCLDGSELAARTLPYAIEVAQRFDSNLILFQVIDIPLFLSPGIPGAASTPVESTALMERAQRRETEARAYLEGLAQTARERGIITESVTLQGIAGEAILEYAESQEATLIALSTHGHGGFRKLVFGSTADYVLKRSRIPVLLVSPQSAL